MEVFENEMTRLSPKWACKFWFKLFLLRIGLIYLRICLEQKTQLFFINCIPVFLLYFPRSSIQFPSSKTIRARNTSLFAEDKAPCALREVKISCLGNHSVIFWQILMCTDFWLCWTGLKNISRKRPNMKT